MRIFLLLIPLAAALLSGCGTPPPYTHQDMMQVTQSFDRLLPVYLSFRDAWFNNNGPVMTHDYALEQRYCTVVDQIDKRDTIDPNINLFAVSAGLDGFCDGIEEYYAAWLKSQHLPYDRQVQPGLTSTGFLNTDLWVAELKQELRHPNAYT